MGLCIIGVHSIVSPLISAVTYSYMVEAFFEAMLGYAFGSSFVQKTFWGLAAFVGRTYREARGRSGEKSWLLYSDLLPRPVSWARMRCGLSINAR